MASPEKKSGLQQALQRFAAASVGATVAELSTLPIDIGKVRLQLQKPLADGTMRYRGDRRYEIRDRTSRQAMNMTAGRVSRRDGCF